MVLVWCLFTCGIRIGLLLTHPLFIHITYSTHPHPRALFTNTLSRLHGVYKTVSLMLLVIVYAWHKQWSPPLVSFITACLRSPLRLQCSAILYGVCVFVCVFVFVYWFVVSLYIALLCNSTSTPPTSTPTSTHSKQLELMMQHIEGVKFFAAAMMELLPPLTQVRLPPPAGAGSGWLHGAPWRFPKHPTAGMCVLFVFIIIILVWCFYDWWWGCVVLDIVYGCVLFEGGVCTPYILQIYSVHILQIYFNITMHPFNAHTVRRPRTAHPTKVKKQGGPACWDNTGTYLLRPESPPPKFRPQQQPIPLLTTRPPVATKTSPTAATAAAAKPARKPRVKQPQQQQQAPKPAAPQLQAMLMAALKARTSGGAGGPGPSSPQGTASPRAGPSPAPVPLKHSSMPSAAPRPVHVGNGAWSPRTVGSGQPVATPTSATGSSATPVGAGVQGAGGAPGGAHGAGAKGPVVSVWVEQMEHVSHVIPPPPPFFHHDHPRCSWCLAIPHHLGMLLPKSQMARSFSSLQCRWRPPSVLHKHGEQGNDHLDCSFVGDIRRASALIQCNNQTVGEALQPQHKIIPVV